MSTKISVWRFPAARAASWQSAYAEKARDSQIRAGRLGGNAGRNAMLNRRLSALFAKRVLPVILAQLPSKYGAAR
jgi:hypothetical protein